MKNSIKNLKNYFQLIVTAVTCFMMGIVKERDSETEEAYDGSGNRTGSRVKKSGIPEQDMENSGDELRMGNSEG